MSDVFSQLSAPFPREAVSWRAQSVKKDGTAAMALAYIDARDVMNRLDEVAGPENWSDTYDVHPNVTICTLAIRTADGGWVSKADGAGDTDVEAEKGRISDAFKRAAVRWGIGRYLYALSSPWVPCETSEYNGKKVWKSWKVDPWTMVRDAPGGPMVERLSAYRAKVVLNQEAILKEIDGAETPRQLDELQDLYTKADVWMPAGWSKRLLERITQARTQLGAVKNEQMDREFIDTIGQKPRTPVPPDFTKLEQAQ